MSNTHPLDAFMQDEESVSKLARKVGCSTSHLRNLRDGRKTASLPLAKRISDATGIRIEAFEGRSSEMAGARA